MFVGRAYWITLGPEGEHLWFVLSEPGGVALAFCLSMTSRDVFGERVLRIPRGTILTDGTRTREPFRVPHDSTLFLAEPRLLTIEEATVLCTEESCHGAIKAKWFYDLRRAARAGVKFIRGRALRESAKAIMDSWFDAEGNPILLR